MGDVYRAQDLLLNREVAIKFLKPTRNFDDAALDRFLREARSAAALNHPHVCTVHEIGEHEDEYFLVMELLDGEPLDKRLTRGPLSPRELLAYADQIADALQAAHAKGIIHRDIKPANVFVTARGEVKLLDFGLAKLTAAAEVGATLESGVPDRRTAPGLLLGTPGFISPEQLGGHDADVRSDIFCLGATLYEMATARPAFTAPSSAMMVDSILHAEPPPASRLNPSVPLSFEAVLAKCLEKNPELRYQSAADLRRDLLRVRRDLESGTNISRTSGRATSRRFTVPLPAVALAAVLVIAACVFWLLKGRPANPAGANLQQRTLTSNAADNPVYAAAISPDGKYLAYADLTGVFLRLLETGETHAIALPPGFCFR